MPRAIDHLVIAAHDLSAQAAFYHRLGFHVGARNRHPWGTENHIVQFDGAFLELIGLADDFVTPSVAPEAFSFASFVGRFLARRQGLAMLVMRSNDAEADRRRFAAEGLGDFARFDFGRMGRRADGTEVEVAFSLAFARSPALPDAGFFVSQHHFPENFWSPALQVHPNGATGVVGVALVVETPADHVEFLRRFVEVGAARAVDGGFALDVDGSTVEILTKEAIAARYGAEASGEDPAPLLAIRIAVADLPVAETALGTGGVAFAQCDETLIIPAHEAFGAVLIFERARGR